MSPKVSIKIGLLGGSFNPAHDGHITISNTALETLGLDEIWWLISPKNPLKDAENLAPIAMRLEKAKQAVADKNIVVKDIETDLGSTYTIDVLNSIIKSNSSINFVWLMGADNFATFDQWHKWQNIPNIMPIAVFNRPDFKDNALQGKASCAMKASRTNTVENLFTHTLPQWIYIDTTHNTQSATDIRKYYQYDWWEDKG